MHLIIDCSIRSIIYHAQIIKKYKLKNTGYENKTQYLSTKQKLLEFKVILVIEN